MSQTNMDASTLARSLRNAAGDSSMEWVCWTVQTSMLLDMADLLTENAKLREELRQWERLTANIELPEYPVTEFQPKDFERENAKLRELVAAYQEVADFPICKLYDERKPDPFSGACAECDGEGCLIQCLNDELRELGVEVD